MEYTLTYIVATKNKYKYLIITLPKLINTRMENEEILVIDGGSTDGTIEYLKKLKEI